MAAPLDGKGRRSVCAEPRVGRDARGGRPPVAVWVLVSCFAIAGCYGYFEPSWSDRPFDSKAWNAPDATSGRRAPTVRQRMVHDLMERVLPCLRLDDVEGTLGVQRGPRMFPDRLGADFEYGIGPAPKLFDDPELDYEHLLIWFDEAGRFEKARIDLPVNYW
jgi:hypothetical protein